MTGRMGPHSARGRSGPWRRRRGTRRPPSRRRRALGQHFLNSGSVPRRAVQDFSPLPGEPVLEIGPGRGALTRLLLGAGAQVLAIEVDRALAHGLERELGDRPGLRLLCADVLEIDLRGVLEETFGAREVRVLSSLPYASGTAIVEKLCAAMPPVAQVRALLQREVVERITARPGAPQYGYLSVVVASRCSAAAGPIVRAGAFDPPPRVQSRWLVLEPSPRPPVPGPRRAAFLEFAGRLFRHPRKTLANNLLAAGYGPDVLAEARRIGDPRARPGAWDVERLAALHARVLALPGAVLE